MRAQDRVPFMKLGMSYFSFGLCIESSFRPKPISRLSMPRSRLKLVAIGMEPPQPMYTGSRPNSSFNAASDVSQFRDVKHYN